MNFLPRILGGRDNSWYKGYYRVVITPDRNPDDSEYSLMTDSTFPDSHIYCGSWLFAAVKATLQKGMLMGPGPAERNICLGQFIMFGDGAF